VSFSKVRVSLTVKTAMFNGTKGVSALAFIGEVQL
jgi:hypothetical protein